MYAPDSTRQGHDDIAINQYNDQMLSFRDLIPGRYFGLWGQVDIIWQSVSVVSKPYKQTIPLLTVIASQMQL